MLTGGKSDLQHHLILWAPVIEWNLVIVVDMYFVGSITEISKPTCLASKHGVIFSSPMLSMLCLIQYAYCIVLCTTSLCVGIG